MKTFLVRVCALACVAVVATPGGSLASMPAPPPDFGSEFPWQNKDIALARVLSIHDGNVVLRTERSYTGYKPAADVTVSLSRISFGYDYLPGSRVRGKPVNIAVGDELIVFSSRWQRDPFVVTGTKVVGPSADFPLVKTLEEIAKIREGGGTSPGLGGDAAQIQQIAKLRAAGGEAARKRAAHRAAIPPFCATPSRSWTDFRRKIPTRHSPVGYAPCGLTRRGRCALRASRQTGYYRAMTRALWQSSADTTQWLRTTFSTEKEASPDDLRSLVKEIIAGFPCARRPRQLLPCDPAR